MQSTIYPALKEINLLVFEQKHLRATHMGNGKLYLCACVVYICVQVCVCVCDWEWKERDVCQGRRSYDRMP